MTCAGLGGRGPRGRVRGLVAGLICLTALALLPAQPAAAAVARPPRWERGCPAPAPSDAAGYERLFHSLHTQAYSGGDGGFSVRLPDGRTLYGFGDTFQGVVTDTGARASGTRLIHNSFLLLRRGCLEPVTGPDGGAVIPDAADGSFYWPSAGVVDRGRLYVFATHVQTAGSGLFGFRVLGTVVIVFELPSGRPPQLRGLQALPGVPDVDPSWGAAVAADARWVYVFGTKAAPSLPAKALYVARVSHGALGTPTDWQFWSGTDWTPAQPVSPAAALIGPEAGVATVLSVFRGWHGAWIAISKRDDFLGTYISGWTARTPSGPWQLTFPTLAAIPSFTADPNELLYNPLAHPEAWLESGKLLISYSRNNFNFDRLLEDADYYALRFVEVSLAE